MNVELRISLKSKRDMSRAHMWSVLVASSVFGISAASPPPGKVRLTIATLHAAALTTARAPGDSLDAPFFVMSVIGPHAGTPAILPEDAPLKIRRDEALGARPLTELSLADGDSVQVLLSVLENATEKGADRLHAADASKDAHALSAAERVEQMTRLLAPFVDQGAHVLGSASLLITNEGGTIYWRSLDCIASCKVVSAPATTPLLATTAQPSGATLELSGHGGTYHLALQARRDP
jgi:hypothetical protein